MSGSTASRGYQYPEDGDLQSEFPAISRQAMEGVDADMASALSGVSDVSTRVDALVRYDTTAGVAVYVHDGTTERLMSYDSGWRNIISYVPSAMGGKIECRRVGSVVEIVGEALQVSGTGTFDFMDPLGAGWRPRLPIYTKATGYWSAAVAADIRAWIDSKLRGVFGSTVDPTVYFQLVYTTSDALPTSLPGTPA